MKKRPDLMKDVDKERKNDLVKQKEINNVEKKIIEVGRNNWSMLKDVIMHYSMVIGKCPKAFLVNNRIQIKFSSSHSMLVLAL